MTGLLALVGGREHTPGCEPIDHALLAWTGRTRPTVAIVPLASGSRTRGRTVSRAVAWWEGLGARALTAPIDPLGAVRVLDEADVIVLTGGVPDRLHRNLARTRVGAHVLDRWRAGAALMGSSSGAMVLGSHRHQVVPPFRIVPGLGVLPGAAVAPHHELTVPRTVTALRARTNPHILVLGIDEATALVGRDGHYAVRGVGTVSVRRGSWMQTWLPGEAVDLHALDHLPSGATSVASMA